MYLSFGADIDAPRGLVQNQNARRREQPPAHQHLLLVPAAQVLKALKQIRSLDAHRDRCRATCLEQLGLSDEPLADERAIQNRYFHVFVHAQRQEEPADLSILGEEGHPVTDCCRGRINFRGDAIDEDVACRCVPQSKERFGQLGSLRSNETGNAENLPRSNVERDVGERPLERQRVH
jgi:hypothetical protein